MSFKTMLPPAALGTNKDNGAAEENNRQGSKSHTVMHNYHLNMNPVLAMQMAASHAR